MNIYFQEKLRDLRTNDKLLQRELANDLGVTKDQIRFWETGRSQPNLEQLFAIAQYFEISVDELLGIEPLQKESPVLSLEERELLDIYHNISAADREVLMTVARKFQTQTSVKKSG